MTLKNPKTLSPQSKNCHRRVKTPRGVAAMAAILLVMVMLFSRTQSSMEGRNLEVLKEGEI